MLRRFHWRSTFLVMALATMVTLWQALPIAAQPETLEQSEQSPDQLTGDDFDKHFLLDMSLHHTLAIAMAGPAAANAAHQETRDLASAIITNQATENSMMAEWSDTWYGLDLPRMLATIIQSTQWPRAVVGQPATEEIPMATMTGELWKLPPRRLEIVFLSQMIPHHQRAIAMAHLAPDRAGHQELQDLAGWIAQGQSAEIQRMNDLLASWYGL